MPRTGPTITIADLGGANVVTLTGVNAPYPIPRLQAPYDVQETIMDEGDGGAPGTRSLSIAGARRSHANLEFQVAYLTSAQVTALETKYYATTPQKLQVSLDGGTTVYSAVFAPNGLELGNWTENYVKQNGTIRLLLGGVI